MTVASHPPSFESAEAFAAKDETAFVSPAALSSEAGPQPLTQSERACLRRAAQRLSPALLHVVQQSTAKSRDRALAALVVLIYGPTPFGGANSIKNVAVRYGMTERNLYQLIDRLRALLQSPLPADDATE
jgi:hypothetical protein